MNIHTTPPHQKKSNRPKGYKRLSALVGLALLGFCAKGVAQTTPFSPDTITLTFIHGTVSNYTLPQATGAEYYDYSPGVFQSNGFMATVTAAGDGDGVVYPIVVANTATTTYSLGGTAHAVMVDAYDSSGNVLDTLTVNLLVLTPLSFPDSLGPYVFYPGVTTTELVTASNGGGTYAYTVAPMLPVGLTLTADEATNVASITSTGDLTVAVGATDHTLTVTDDSGATDTAVISIEVPGIAFAKTAYTFTFIEGVASSQALPTASGLQSALRYKVNDNSLITGAELAHSTLPSTTAGAAVISSTADTPLTTEVVTFTLFAYHDSNGLMGMTKIYIFVVETDTSGEHLNAVNQEVITKVAGAMVDGALGAITERLTAANSATTLASIDGQTPVVALANYAHALGDDDVDSALANSRFVLPFAALPSNSNVGAIWGSTQTRELDGDVDAADWSGDVGGLHLGVDFNIGDNLVGVAVSKSDADIDYKSPKAQGGFNEGEYEVALTALYPYINRRFGDVDVWGIVGLGEGEMTATPKGSEAIDSDLSLTALAAGAALQIVPSLQLRLEAHTADIDIEGNEVRGLVQQDLSTNTVRAMARWHNLYLTPSVPLFTALHTAFFEAGMRRDSGDGENHRGAMEAALGWQYHGQRAEIEAAVNGLFGRKDYRAWGAYTNLRVSGGDDGQGLALRLRPSYGEEQTEFGRVWNAESFDDNVDVGNQTLRTEMRLSYGIQSAGGLVAPFVDAVATDNADNNNIYRLGVDWSPHRYFDVNLAGERHVNANAADEQRVLVKGAVKF